MLGIDVVVGFAATAITDVVVGPLTDQTAAAVAVAVAVAAANAVVGVVAGAS